MLSLADNKKGLVLITGSAGTGKSTTLACMIDRINKSRDSHIITMEDPIEYIHRHEKSIVTQREISIDTPGYLGSLRSALRESPDVILLGEMRDYDTISAAITAAETGAPLLSTLHTSSAANTINRILDVFPANQQKQIKIQLAQILKGAVCQQLVPSEGLGRCMNNEMFYLRMIGMAIEDAGFDKLNAALDSGDTKAAFEAAHALKGVLGNLALTPLYKPASELTELLRAGGGGDFAEYRDAINERRAALKALIQG